MVRVIADLGRHSPCCHIVQEDLKGFDYRQDRVVVDGFVVTSRGAGTAMEFALELVRILVGPEKADLLAQLMIV